MDGMMFEYDDTTDTAYIFLRPDIPRAFGERLDDSRYIDFGSDDLPVGVELLGVSRGVDTQDLPERDRVEAILTEHHIRLFA